MFSGIGSSEILLILIFALIFLGPRRLAETARAVGKATRYIRRMISEIQHEILSEISKDDHTSPPG
ncbi:MAG: Sec-independent protein translocase subunit TatA/TatB [bacterium]